MRTVVQKVKKKKKKITSDNYRKHPFLECVPVLSFEIKVQAEEGFFPSFFMALNLPNMAIFPLNKELSPHISKLIFKCDSKESRFTDLLLTLT